MNYSRNTRSIGSIILLSIITCGIYYWVWVYSVTRDLAEYNEDYSVSPGMAVLLGLITCGIYHLYWWYKIGEMFVIAQEKAGKRYVIDNKILFLILSLFGMGIVSACILQSDLNRFWIDSTDNYRSNPNDF
mgnify:CR=1 FL=1